MRAGVLIIGSLLWDNGPDNSRQTWRREHLSDTERIFVKVPIQYGRKSRTRGNTYTMVFRKDGLLGQAVVIPCLSHITTVEELIRETIALWNAESSQDNDERVGSYWGCVGVTFRDPELAAHLSQEWAVYFTKHAKRPVPPVDGKGILNIPWPKKADGYPLSEVQVLLATATQPENMFPTPNQIADAWIHHGYERYFFENIKHGIRTPHDDAIWKRIKTASPDWINKPEYAEAISILEASA